MKSLWLLLLFIYLGGVQCRYQQPLRQKMIKSVSYSSTSLPQSAVNFLRGFPRGGNPNHLGKVSSSDISGSTFVWWKANSASGGSESYFHGIASMSIACIVFGSISIACCCGFCLGRCAWNKLGGRQVTPPTTRYLPKHINLLKASVVLFTLIMIILFSIALSSNAGVSASEDNTLYGIETLENYLWRYYGPLNNFLSIAQDGLNLAQSLNSLVFTTLPSVSQLTADERCLNSTFDLLQLQSSIYTQLSSVQFSLSTSLNYSSLNLLLQQLQVELADGIPNLVPLNSDLNTYDLSLLEVGNLTLLLDNLIALESSLNLLTNMDTTINSLTNIQSQRNGLTTLIQSISDALTQLENAIGTLPDLTDLSARISGTTPTDQSDLTARLTSLNDSLAAMPDGTVLSQDIVALNNSLNLLREEVKVETELTQIQNAIDSLPDLDQVATQISALNAMRANLTDQLASLIGGTTTAAQYGDPLKATTIALLVAIDDATNAIAEVNTTVNGDGSNPNATLLYQLSSWNTSFSSLSCMNPLYSRLLIVNSSLFYLPSDVDAFFVYRDDLVALSVNPNFTTTIITGYNEAANISDVFAEAPDFSSLSSQLAFLNASFAVVDWNELLAELSAMDQSLVSLPSLTPYPAALLSLNSSVVGTDLASVISQLNSLGAAIGDVPSLEVYADSYTQLESNRLTLFSLISTAISVMDPSGSISEPTRNSLLIEISDLQTTVNNRPSSSALSAALSELTNAVTSMQDLTPVYQRLSSIQSSSQSLPSIETLRLALSDFVSSLDNATHYHFLVDTQALLALNQSIENAATYNLDPLITDTEAYQSELSAIDFTAILNATKNSDEWLPLSVQTTIMEVLQLLADSRNSLLEFNTTVANMAHSVDALNDQVTNVKDTRYSFDKDKNDLYNQIQDWDLIRLFAANFIVALPVFFALLGFISCTFKKRGYSMVMALAIFGLIFFFLFLAALQLPIAAILADHCSPAAQNQFISAQLAGKNITTEEFFDMTGIELTQNVSLDATYNYLRFCEGEKPEFLVKLEDPRAILSTSGNYSYNFTEVRESVVAAAHNLTLHPSVFVTFDTLDELVDNASELINNTVTELVNCEEIAAAIQPAMDALCVDFAGAFALNTCMYILIALCMSPGVCIGIKGYKWFDPRFTANAYYKAQRDEEKKAIDMDVPKAGPRQQAASVGRRSVAASPSPRPQAASVGRRSVAPGSPSLDRSLSQAPQPGRASIRGDMWRCHACSYDNQADAPTCQMCLSPRGGGGQMLGAGQRQQQQRQQAEYYIEPADDYSPGVIDAGDGAVIVPVGHYM